MLCFAATSVCFVFLTLIPPPPRSTLFPYTTLFRSKVLEEVHDRADLGEIERLVIDEEVQHALPEVLVLQHLRSEEHTSELQSLRHLVCRLLLEKKNESGARRDYRHEDSTYKTRNSN